MFPDPSRVRIDQTTVMSGLRQNTSISFYQEHGCELCLKCTNKKTVFYCIYCLWFIFAVEFLFDTHFLTIYKLHNIPQSGRY